MPLELPFFQRAMLASGLAALVCAVVGTFVVLKGLAFMGDAVAFLFGGNVFWGALAWAVPASLLITLISQRAKLQMDTAIGVIFAGGFALGIILMSRVDNYAANLFGLLFGNVLGVSWAEVVLIGVITAAVLLAILTLSRIHRKTTLGTVLEEARGCSSESGIMVLEQKTAWKQGAPNRCCHRTIPTGSASSLMTTA